MAICIINHGDPIVKPVKPVICINQRSYDMGFDIVFQIKGIFDVPLVIVGGKHPVHEGLVVIKV